jgi:hypothetical protein
MTGNVPFLVKDLVLLAVSFYLLRQDVVRATVASEADLTRNDGAINPPDGLRQI